MRAGTYPTQRKQRNLPHMKMAPPKVGAPPTKTRKQPKIPPVAPVFEETPGSLASQSSFHRNYIPP